MQDKDPLDLRSFFSLEHCVCVAPVNIKSTTSLLSCKYTPDKKKTRK